MVLFFSYRLLCVTPPFKCYYSHPCFLFFITLLPLSLFPHSISHFRRKTSPFSLLSNLPATIYLTGSFFIFRQVPWALVSIFQIIYMYVHFDIYLVEILLILMFPIKFSTENHIIYIYI
jgi:hypothetical protein